jgi:hypothetical protein
MKRTLRGATIALLVLVGMGAGYALPTLTTYPILRLTPFYTSNIAWVGSTGGQVGGRINFFIAADSLKIGDVVYITTLDSVTKSTTIANYNTIAGVVVGGTRSSSQASVASADVGTLCATAGQTVYVLKQGRTWMANDSMAAGITGGALVKPSIYNAGKIGLKGAALDSLNRVIGRAVFAAAASTTVLVDVNIK